MAAGARKRKKRKRQPSAAEPDAEKLAETVRATVLGQFQGAVELAANDPAAFRKRCREVGAELGIAGKNVAQIIDSARRSPELRSRAVDELLRRGARIVRSRFGV